ncbi:sensor histidine kinase [Streptomyces sp. NPDC012637]|uniref:sensor histidine kinase n=1 Tax=Streptomyces sp. NPDC012637 TaxID=3364842 RepID=UPI0036E643CB
MPLTPTARVLRLRRRISLLFALTSALGLITMGVLAVRSDSGRWREQLDHAMDADTSWALGLLETDENGRLETDVLADNVNTACPPLTVLLVNGDDPGDLTVRHAPAQPCLAVSPGVVLEAGRAAARAGEARAFDRRTTDGAPVRVFAMPFYPSDDEVAADGAGGADGPDGAGGADEPNAAGEASAAGRASGVGEASGADETDGAEGAGGADGASGAGYAGPQGVLVTLADATAQRDDHRRLVWLVTGGCAVLVLLSAAVGHVLSGRAVRPALTALAQQEAFLADAAHDLRTPAASLRTLAETALRGETDSADVHRRTLRLAEGMGGLVDGLLTRARLLSGTAAVARQPLRLDQLVEAVAEEAAGGPARGHRVRVEAEETVVLADPDLLRRAVDNLLGNALAHGHAPGAPADVLLTVARDGTLTVEDAGPGLPPEVAGALFERFRSGSGSTGLGLSIASWVAHAHGGTLTAPGTGQGGGARFVLRLPTPD